MPLHRKAVDMATVEANPHAAVIKESVLSMCFPTVLGHMGRGGSMNTSFKRKRITKGGDVRGPHGFS